MPTTHIDDLAAFVTASPSSYHAAEEVARRLVDRGFRRQLETDAWDSTPGGHVLVREGAVVAWRIPETLSENPRFAIVGAHTDSPSLKLKPQPTASNVGYAQAAMELYGGLLLNSWLDREFGLAGRLTLRDGTTTLVRTPGWLRIPQLAPHMDRSVNESLHLDRQHHMKPLLGLTGGRDLMTAIADVAGVHPDDILGHDLFAYVTEPPAVIGIDADLFASSRMDNLSSVHAGLTALLAAGEGPDVAVLACFDHEEIGSSSTTGACGPLLEAVLGRIAEGLSIHGDHYDRMLARSVQVSADAGNAIHPNYAHLHDPEHQPTLNKGPLLKMSATQRYTTDGFGVALWRRLAERVDIPVQFFVSNNAVPSGSTIGPLSATRLGIKTLDVGIPLLSMHSTRELAGTKDLPWLADVLAEFYRGQW
ncbi:MAG: M18 family aminopeptidase [Propionibacteriaceae bacterium]|nr:M18 family aminopeptidase [Micropruina sp.]HBX80983.1 M18 family aminopeptidase [Propionibacteriaceae bacterium]HBY24435.1 M18 family aminopeptidase [Propionibacteriaceae bacterium]